MKTKFIAVMIAAVFIAATSGKSQNQVYFPVDTVPGITIKLEEEVATTTPTAVVSETQPQVLQRTWANLERGLKEIMESPTMLSQTVDTIEYIYEVKDVPCYGTLYLCIHGGENQKVYVLSMTNPLLEDLDPISAINTKKCRKGNDTGVISTPNIGRPRPIPRRKKGMNEGINV